MSNRCVYNDFRVYGNDVAPVNSHCCTALNRIRFWRRLTLLARANNGRGTTHSFEFCHTNSAGSNDERKCCCTRVHSYTCKMQMTHIVCTCSYTCCFLHWTCFCTRHSPAMTLYALFCIDSYAYCLIKPYFGFSDTSDLVTFFVLPEGCR